MASSPPVVSVVIPCFNQGATLDEAVHSVLRQTFTDFEIVIVNDGSTDPFTRELLATYHKPKTRVVATPNRGLAAARNTAIRHSSGRYILPLDGDDTIHPMYLARAVPILEGNADVMIVHSETRYFGEKKGDARLPDFSRERMLFQNLIHCTAFFRRAHFDETEGYRSNAHGHEDWDLWLSLMELRPVDRVVKIAKPLFNYRIRTGSMLRSMTEAERRRSRLHIFLNHVALYERYGIDPIGLYSADQQLSEDCRQLESEYLAIRTSPEYRVGSLLVTPFASTSALTRTKLAQLKHWMWFRNSPGLAATPNPIHLAQDSGVGETTLSWWPGFAKVIEIRVDAPDGPLFVRAVSTGSAISGKWARDGTMFFLQDVSEGRALTPANTLASVRVNGRITAQTAVSMRRATRSPPRTPSVPAVILMYHRVTSVGPLDPWGLRVTPRHFAEHVEVLRRHFNPWPLQRALTALRNGTLPPRTAVVTFDDGYRDNFTDAKPLLQKFEIPATVFVTSGYIGSREGFWWDELHSLMARHHSSDPQSFHDAFARLQAMTYTERQAALSALRPPGAVLDAEAMHPPLSLTEAVALDECELIEVGSHTTTHPLLTALPHDAQRHEIVCGKAQLEDVLGHPVTSFAYPHGLYTAPTVKLVQEAGFLCACSTDVAMLRPEVDLFRLPRVQVIDGDGEQFSRWLSNWFGGEHARNPL
jgi:peptidoglycan/xylan/chitin deacetylase (PgdA/CDA1 family)